MEGLGIDQDYENVGYILLAPNMGSCEHSNEPSNSIRLGISLSGGDRQS
jgi:hypothetical protein